MQPDVALEEIYKELYPFSEIVGNSNVLIMPSQHSAAISYKMIKSISNLCTINPNQISIKGKTTEKLGLIGKEKAIASEVVVSVVRYD